MYQGNWQCSVCGGSITELPFEPRSEKGLTCRACYAKSKQPAGVGAGPEANSEIDAAAAASEPDMNDAPPFDPDGAPATDQPDAPSFATEGQLDDTGAAPEKKQFTGEWTCSICGGPITSLPFEPRSTANLKCIDCFKQQKG